MPERLSVSVLTFFGQSGKREVDVGVDWTSDSRFLYFTGRGGLPTVALSSESPHSEATLTLGDDFSARRLVLGAMRTDMEPPPNASSLPFVDDWGLQFLRFGSTSPVMSVFVESRRDGKVGMEIQKPNGNSWIVP